MCDICIDGLEEVKSLMTSEELKVRVTSDDVITMVILETFVDVKITKIYSSFKPSSPQKLINDVSDKMCKVLPASMSEKCITMVDDVITESFQVLTDLLSVFSPKTVCEMITMCPKTAG